MSTSRLLKTARTESNMAWPLLAPPPLAPPGGEIAPVAAPPAEQVSADVTTTKPVGLDAIVVGLRVVPSSVIVYVPAGTVLVAVRL